MTHTPGPWRYSEGFCTITTSRRGILEGSKEIATVSEFDKSPETVRANGLVMTAAPDLLAAAEAANDLICDICKELDKTPDLLLTVQQLRAAIAKARGEN
jgi:hypothetical protein